ncbi:MAG: SDR family NAD(P)-dependent oxidoreductase [Fibrella sp.]|nr:SDR family NAD(P)-dependent oxidoreductase [Armatimonadota bacterium]
MGILNGKTALVTGASRGLGRAISLRFAAEGALVAVHYGRSENEANAVVSEIEAAGGKAFVVQADIASVASIEALFTRLDGELTRRTGSNQFDILVNNAGVAEMIPFEETTEEQFDYHFDINVKGMFFTTQKALPRLRDNGRIINLSSVVSQFAFPPVVAYASTKGAVNAFTLQIAAIAAERGITVNTLAPGAIETDMNPWLQSAEGQQMALGMQALKRVGKATDVSNAALLIASDDSAWMTANFVNVSGGTKL